MHVTQIKAVNGYPSRNRLSACEHVSICSLCEGFQVLSVPASDPTSPAAVDNTSVTTAYKQYSLTTSHVPFVKENSFTVLETELKSS